MALAANLAWPDLAMSFDIDMPRNSDGVLSSSGSPTASTTYQGSVDGADGNVNAPPLAAKRGLRVGAIWLPTAPTVTRYLKRTGPSTTTPSVRQRA